MQSLYFSVFGSANHQEIWEITSALENHKSEIADWDLGAGIYIDFYILKNSMQEESAMDDSVWTLSSASITFYWIYVIFLEKLNICKWKQRYFIFQDSLLKKNESCKSFFGRLNDSLLVWGSKLPVESRACYSKMTDELCELFMKAPGVAMNLHMECFQTMLNAPVADDRKSSYLQEAVSVFTEILCSDSWQKYPCHHLNMVSVQTCTESGWPLIPRQHSEELRVFARLMCGRNV